MTEMKPEHLAKEAERLLRDEVLNQALDGMRKEALEDLAVEDVEEPLAILRLQQRIAAVDEFRGMLNRYILAASTE